MNWMRFKGLLFSREAQFFWFFLFLLIVLTQAEIASANDASRFAAIQALVEHHTFIIDQTDFINTVDKYFYQGHFYSDKPVFLALYSSIFYAFLHTIGITFSNQPTLTIYLLTLIVTGITTCVGLVYFYKTLKLLQVDDRWAQIVLLLAGTGTLMLPYSTVFSNHPVSGALLSLGFYYLLRSRTDARFALLAGGFTTLAGSVDIAAFLFMPFFGLSLIQQPLKTKAAYGLACLPILTAYFLLNIELSGSLIPPAMNQKLWDYPGSIFNANNLSGVAYHTNLPRLLKYAFNMILGKRGLFAYTPILLCSSYGFVKLLRQKSFPYRLEYLSLLLAAIAYISMYIFRSSDYSGYCYGVRWYTNLMLLLCLPLAQLSEENKASRRFRAVFLSLALLSIALAFVGSIHPFISSVPGDGNTFVSVVLSVVANDQYLGEPGMSHNHFRVAVVTIAAVLTMLLWKRLFDRFLAHNKNLATVPPVLPQ